MAAQTDRGVTGPQRVIFTVNHGEMLAALQAARRLTAAVRHPRVRLEPAGTDVLNVVVDTDSGSPMYTTPVPITAGTGPTHR